MIKKLLCAGALLTGLFTANAQEKVKLTDSDIKTAERFISNSILSQNKASAIPDGDTLWYFYNKHSVRNNSVQANSFYTIKSPVTGTNTISEFGSSFLNPGGATVTVYGAYVLAMRHAASTNTIINLRVYIYSASPSGIPGSKLDSAMTSVTNPTAGTFCNATFTAPVTVTGAFFMSVKPIVGPGDTMRTFMDNAYLPASNVPTVALKYGEGLSYTKYNGTFQVNSSFYNTGFSNSDLENIVAPKVTFAYTASSTVMPTNTTSPTGYCANLPITFTSTSNTAIIENRQFNWNAFGPVWQPSPAINTSTWIPTADPIYNWSFAGTTPTGVATGSTVSHTYSGAGTGQANLIVKYQHGSGSKAKTQTLAPVISVTVVNCGIVGINANTADPNMSVYPNPTINGKTNISGLQGVNTIAVYNMLGQAVSTQTTDKDVLSVDLSNQAPGTYMLRITDSANHAKVLKVINQ